jgi:hypothetical protein
MDNLDCPLSTEAQSLLSRIQPRIQAQLQSIRAIPVSILVWGPNPQLNSDCARLRKELRNVLRTNGHAAIFSEELYDPALPDSLRIQQIAHAQEFDLIVSVPEGPGSIGEVHDFAADRRVDAKMLIFLPAEHMDGYSPKSLQALESLVSAQIVKYSENDGSEFIVGRVIEEAQRIREIKYILAGRY